MIDPEFVKPSIVTKGTVSFSSSAAAAYLHAGGILVKDGGAAASCTFGCSSSSSSSGLNRCLSPRELVSGV